MTLKKVAPISMPRPIKPHPTTRRPVYREGEIGLFADGGGGDAATDAAPSTLGVYEWADKVVPIIEDMDRKARDSANTLDSRLEVLERGVSDVRVAYIQGSPVILDVTAKSTIYLVRTVAGTVTITLPPFEKLAGKQFTFKKMDAANTLTLRVGSGLVEGAATLSWATQYDSRTLVSDGITGWWIV